MADSLERFKQAQADPTTGIQSALRELRAGRKRGHWIWYVFPQLSGLGQSAISMRYGLNGVDEADAYLRDEELRGTLLAAAEAVARHLRSANAPLAAVMGSEIDAVKLVSSMTLFRAIADRLVAGAPADARETLSAIRRHADAILRVAAAQGYPPCAFTLQRLSSEA
jgi:uncharacterized protein (DUF1810 family)